jgi:hypothetical protein
VRLFATALLLSLALAPPALAQDASTAAPRLSPGQMEALKRQLDAAPKTPGRAAMMQKLLKLALAMKAKKPVATEDLMALTAYLREANGDKGGDPAFEAAMKQLEAGILKIQGQGQPGANEDLEELKKEFEGY